MPKTDTEGSKSRVKKLLVGAGVVGGVIALGVLGLTGASETPPSQLKAAPQDRIQGGSGGEGSPEYNARLEQLSAEQA